MNVKHSQSLEPNIICFSATYHQCYTLPLLFRREVAEDGAGNGFRDFVHV